MTTLPTNETRALWAENAVNTFARATYGGATFTIAVIDQPNKGDDAYTMIQDLIADLLHLARRHGWDADDMIRLATENFACEVREEKDLPYDPSVADRHMAVITEAQAERRITTPRTPAEILRYHMTGAIERGEAEAIVEIPASAPLFPMSEISVETVMCLWEAALEMRENPSTDPVAALGEASLRKQLDTWWADHGTGTMRHAVMQLVPACDAEWRALGKDAQADAAPYDWEYVPAFLRRCITDGRLAQAIDNQYTTAPVPILPKI